MHRPIQFRAGDTVQAALQVQHVRKRLERRFGSTLEFDLELFEMVERPFVTLDRDFVDAQLHPSAGGLEAAHPSQLAERQQLEQRLVAAQFEDRRARLGSGPGDRRLGRVRGSFELLPSMESTAGRCVGLEADLRAT